MATRKTNGSNSATLDELPVATKDEAFGATDVAQVSEAEQVARLAQGDSGINLSPEDRTTPRLQLLQALSPQVSDGEGKAGDFINTLTGVNYGNSLEMHVLFNYKTRLKWDIESSSVDCYSPDGVTGTVYGKCSACQFSKWGAEKKPPACDDMKAVIMYVPEDEAVVLFSAKKTAVKPVKQLLLDIDNSKSKAFYGRYELSSVKVTEAKKSWFVPAFKLVGHLTSIADFKKLENLANSAREAQRRNAVSQLALDGDTTNTAIAKSGSEVSEY